MDGEACAAALECLSGYCSNLGPVPGFCYTPGSKAYGDTCQVEDECQSGDCQVGLCSCNGSHSHCPGTESCNASNLCTATGTGCTNDPQCRSGHCGNVLAPPVSACVQCTAQGHCGTGRWCDATGNCQQQGANGQACAAALECQSGYCSNLGPVPGFCYTPGSRAYGDTCQVEDECQSGDCQSGLCSCNGSFSYCPGTESCNAANLCTSNGSGCTTDPQCRSGHCGNVLAPPVSACVQCTAQGHCGTGNWCDAFGTCQPQWANGHACASAVECLSSYCSNLGPVPGFCYSPYSKPAGTTCMISHECQSAQCLMGLCT